MESVQQEQLDLQRFMANDVEALVDSSEDIKVRLTNMVAMMLALNSARSDKGAPPEPSEDQPSS